MQSIASVVFADLRARQIEQTLWGPTQHERLQEMHPVKKKERKKEPPLLSSPLPLAGQPNLRELLCVRQYVQTISVKIHTIPDTSILHEVWPSSYTARAFRHRRSRSQTRSSARRHAFEQNLCRGDREVRRNGS